MTCRAAMSESLEQAVRFEPLRGVTRDTLPPRLCDPKICGIFDFTVRSCTAGRPQISKPKEAPSRFAPVGCGLLFSTGFQTNWFVAAGAGRKQPVFRNRRKVVR
mmetsp:Transcript_24569/g.57658  ORF Transcript_24569/g.57658 Transcript_24569/m.57658 type:complete len:104 (-) Transcript_24569:597-908(-)